MEEKKAERALNLRTRLNKIPDKSKIKSMALSKIMVPNNLSTGTPEALYRLVQRTTSPALGKIILAKYPAAMECVAKEGRTL